MNRWWIAAAGAALGGALVWRSKRETGPLRTRALTQASREAGRWGDRAPDTARVDQYLAGVVPHGAALVQMNNDSNRVNFCAAAVGWCEHKTGLRGIAPWRSGAKQLMHDAQAGLGGAWHPVSQVRRGDWQPPRGALAIYHRGAADAVTGHVDFVTAVRDSQTYFVLGANGPGRRWYDAARRFDSSVLLGFVVHGETDSSSAVLSSEVVLPFDFVEPPLTEDEWSAMGGG